MFLISIFAEEQSLPEFPLIPASRGFCITLRKTLATFKDVLVKEGIIQRPAHALRTSESCRELKFDSRDSADVIKRPMKSIMSEYSLSRGVIEEASREATLASTSRTSPPKEARKDNAAEHTAS